MNTPKIVLTVLTVAALGATPTAATAAGDGSGQTDNGKLATNHNEVMATSPLA